MEESIRDFRAELDNLANTFEASEDYRDLREFFEDMQAKGLTIRHEYGLKQADLSYPRTTTFPEARPQSWFGIYVGQQNMAPIGS